MPSALAPLDSSLVKLKRLFKPVEPDPYPTSRYSQDVYSGGAQSFVSLGTDSWTASATQFNVLGQQWQNSGLGAGGKNVTTPRSVFGTAPGHVQEFEFEFNDTKFDLMLVTNGAYDTQIYITEGGKTWRLKDKPLGEVGSSYRFRNITFTDNRPRQIRVVIAGSAYFVQLNREQRAVVRAAKDRPFYIADGDSYFESIHAQNAGSAETYFTYGNIDAIFEATGFVGARHAEGGTGLFNNGDGTARTDDTGSSVASSRWGSAQRISAAGPSLAQKPIFWLFNGTINDGALSGGKAPYKARLFEIYQAINAVDSGIGFIHVGPEPYNNGFAAGSAHDLNRQAIVEAVAQHGNGWGFIDPTRDPQGAWYTGLGFENSVTSSPQAQLTGADGVHGNFHGYDYYGKEIARHLGEIAVPLVRAEKFI
jgi:hypothetical protein